MGSMIVAIVFIAIFIVFMLSVFAPMHSQKKFWVIIRKIRHIMDLTSYYFYLTCAILSCIVALWYFINKI